MEDIVCFVFFLVCMPVVCYNKEKSFVWSKAAGSKTVEKIGDLGNRTSERRRLWGRRLRLLWFSLTNQVFCSVLSPRFGISSLGTSTEGVTENGMEWSGSIDTIHNFCQGKHEKCVTNWAELNQTAWWKQGQRFCKAFLYFETFYLNVFIPLVGCFVSG